jgi:hypothetical protein
MPDPLLGPKLKVESAKRYLSYFQEVLSAFFKTKPYELVAEQDPRTSESVYRVRVYGCVPDELSVIAGDVVHNLRSALDQMVCALVRANRRQVSGGNSFPIMGSRKKFEEACVGKLKNTSAKANRFIRRLKPYKGGNDAFWMLAELDNMDKHNEIVPVAAGQVQFSRRMGLMPGFFRTPDGALAIGGGPPGSVALGYEIGFVTPDNAKVVQLLHDNCEVFREAAVFSDFPSEAQVSIAITFGKTDVTQGEPIFEVLEGLIKLVQRVIDIVERRVL